MILRPIDLVQTSSFTFWCYQVNSATKICCGRCIYALNRGYTLQVDCCVPILATGGMAITIVKVMVSAIAEPKIPMEGNRKKYGEGYLSAEESVASTGLSAQAVEPALHPQRYLIDTTDEIKHPHSRSTNNSSTFTFNSGAVAPPCQQKRDLLNQSLPEAPSASIPRPNSKRQRTCPARKEPCYLCAPTSWCDPRICPCAKAGRPCADCGPAERRRCANHHRPRSFPASRLAQLKEAAAAECITQSQIGFNQLFNVDAATNAGPSSRKSTADHSGGTRRLSLLLETMPTSLLLQQQQAQTQQPLIRQRTWRHRSTSMLERRGL